MPNRIDKVSKCKKQMQAKKLYIKITKDQFIHHLLKLRKNSQNFLLNQIQDNFNIEYCITLVLI